MMGKAGSIVILLYAILSILVFKDYGLNIDESIERKHGIVTYNYILNMLGIENGVKNSNLYDLSNYDHKDYGSLFQVISYSLELALNINTTRQIFLLRHALTMLLFILALYQFQKCLYVFFRNAAYCLSGIILIVTCPRIFADSF